MENIVWSALGVATPILLIIYWKKRNAVWGGFTVGIVIGLGIALVSGFNWIVIGKGAIAGTMVGLLAELLGKASDLIRKL